MALTSTHHGFFKGISQYAGEHNWHLHTFMAYSGKIPLGWHGDGIISFTGYRDDLAEFIRQAPFPKVELSLVRDDLDVPRVAIDNFRIGQLAAEYFLERHFKNFAWAPFAQDTPNQERRDGFIQSLKQFAPELNTLPTALVTKDQSHSIDWGQSRRNLIHTLKNISKPFAVFAYNDSVGVEVIDACLEAELLVPEQVAVLGVDNDQIVCESVPIPLSSVQLNLDTLAYEGSSLLDRLMNGQSPPENLIRVPPRGIFTRLSTDILAMDNVEVAKALRYIWTNFDNHLLSAEEVASQTALTSRGLRKAFQSKLQRSIHNEIMRVRMNRITELLTNTKMTISKIAEHSGFSSANNLFRAFRKTKNMSPGKYRTLFNQSDHTRKAAPPNS